MAQFTVSLPNPIATPPLQYMAGVFHGSSPLPQKHYPTAVVTPSMHTGYVINALPNGGFGGVVLPPARHVSIGVVDVVDLFERGVPTEVTLNVKVPVSLDISSRISNSCRDVRDNRNTRDANHGIGNGSGVRRVIRTKFDHKRRITTLFYDDGTYEDKPGNHW